MLALSQPVEARIIYTPANKSISPHEFYRLDVDHDGTADFTLYNTNHTTDTGGTAWLSVWAAGSNAVRGFYDKYGILRWAYALKSDAKIGPKKSFVERGARMVEVASSSTVFGKWNNVRKRYLGLKFTTHGKTHYGWARLNVSILFRSFISAKLTGYAYETIPDKPIVAGDEGTGARSLGRLALGTDWRKLARR
jgi:hypothetical protein